MKFPGFNEDLIYKFVIKDLDKAEAEYLPKTAEWFSNQKLLPHIGDTIIPLETEAAKKPFYVVHSIVWDTHKNEVVFVLERDLKKRV
ncbi:MAG TPA: hypothetical protein VJY62_19835 [Bacteroidia bacterium]|nr:hypothetical protein [Bacteroidia bacterium]